VPKTRSFGQLDSHRALRWYIAARPKTANMAPKKKETQKLTLTEFMNDTSLGGGGSWADEVEDTLGTQPLPPSDRRTMTSYGGGNDRGYHSIRDNLPQELPTKPPYTAHLGNLSYDATVETVTEFFEDCNIVNVRIIEDREQNRPKGFAYAEFGDLEGLKTALTRDGQTFQGRTIRVKVADPPRGGGFGSSEGMRDLDWGAKRGPLADLPGRGGDRRGGDFGERRREYQPNDDGKVRDFNSWERRGPLSPLAQPERPESREGSRSRTMDTRSESFRGGNRRASPAAWGPSEGQDGSRPPRREFSERPERPERVPTAAEKDFNWRNNMRPDSAVKSPGESREGSEAPSSPAPSAALPAGRPKLNLTKRTVSEATDAAAASNPSDSKASPFGAARPIDTATREREIEEKRQLKGKRL
jgi:translation initiation factor 4B